MPLLRFDILTGEFAIIATERAKRPSDFKAAQRAEPLPERDPNCPFCPGNEKLTPPEIYAIRDGGEPDGKDWVVRVVPNKFPALSPAGKALAGELEGLKSGSSALPHISNSSMYWEVPAIGSHEVVIESERHDLNLGSYTKEHLTEVLVTIRMRVQMLYEQQEVKYVQVFRNFGAGAGASLSHPHFQIMALPVMPPRPSMEAARFLQYESATRRCLLCDLVEREIEKGLRVVSKNENYVVICPFASTHSFETVIVPRKHSSSFLTASDGELAALAESMGALFASYEDAFSSLPYNLVLHSAPMPGRSPTGQPFHWHIHVMPRLTMAAGLEMGTGVHINPTPPESVAELLGSLNHNK